MAGIIIEILQRKEALAQGNRLGVCSVYFPEEVRLEEPVTES